MLIVISEDGRFISSKSGVDPSWNHGEKCVQEKVPTDRQTDRQTAFRLYIVDKLMMHVIKNIRIYAIGTG